MKKATIFVLVLFCGTLFITADICIKEKNHTDSYYYGGVVHPEDNITAEIWFTDSKMAYITPGRKVIVDQSINRIYIINLRNQTYVETSLPLDLKNILPQQIVTALQPRERTGTVIKSGETKKIKDWDCVAYDSTVSQPYALEIKYWTSKDVPFDWAQLNRMLTPVRRLGNYSNSYIERLNEMEGCTVLADVKIYLQGTCFGSTSQVMEISRKVPPDTVYLIDRGFQKNSLMTIQDLQNR